MPGLSIVIRVDRPRGAELAAGTLVQIVITVVSDYNVPILLTTGCARFPNQEVSDSMRGFCANLYIHG